MEHRASTFKQIHEIVFHGKGGYDWYTVYTMPNWLRRYTFHELKKYYVLFNSRSNEYDYEQEYEGYDLKSEDISKEDMQNINESINEIKKNKKRFH